MRTRIATLMLLMQAASQGCHSPGQPAANPWSTQRVPVPLREQMSPQSSVPRVPRSSPQATSPAGPTNAPLGATQGERLVPIPTPEPLTRSGATSSEITVEARKPVEGGPAEQPSLRLTPKTSPRSSNSASTNGRVAPSRDTLGDELVPEWDISPSASSNRIQTEPARKPASSDSRKSSLRLGFEALPAPPGDLDLKVRSQRQRPLSEPVTFDVFVTNHSTQTMTNVRLDVQFDDTLYFPGSQTTQLKKDLGTLRPGQVRDLRLTLVSGKLGKHQCVFTLTADGHNPIEHTATVEYVHPKLQLTLVGPGRRTLGSRAEFTIKVANLTEEPIEDLKVTLRHDVVLAPITATGGFLRDPEQLSWSIGKLGAGEGIQLQAEFDCKQQAEQACLTAEARSESLSAEATENCFTVVAVPGLLDLRVSDRTDPVAVGAEAEFEITVQNLGLQSLPTVQLTVQTSEHLRAGTVEARLDDQIVTLGKTETNNNLKLTLSEPLRPDGLLRITLRAKALHAGDGEIRVVATHDTDSATIESSEFLSINP